MLEGMLTGLVAGGLIVFGLLQVSGRLLANGNRTVGSRSIEWWREQLRELYIDAAAQTIVPALNEFRDALSDVHQVLTEIRDDNRTQGAAIQEVLLRARLRAEVSDVLARAQARNEGAADIPTEKYGA